LNPVNFLVTKARNWYIVKFANSICKQQQINLPHSLGLRDADVFTDIFFKRIYAPCFPFYQNCTIIDIGAHKGFFSLFASKYAGKSSKIFAIEPEHSNFNSILENVKANDYKNIFANQCAIAGTTGKKQLFLSESVNHSLIQTSDTHPYVKQTGIVEVQTYSLEDFFVTNNITNVNLLKIDCEGGEYDILFNTKDYTFAKIETISLEFHDVSSTESNIYSLLRFLISKKYSVVSFEFQRTAMPLSMGILIVTRI
jgi:FkbM family methyltransferase